MIITNVQGVDVSRSNGFVDYHKLAANGVRFVYIKATEAIFVNAARAAFYRDNYNRARAAGLYVGAYHYFRGNYDSTAQANNVLSVVGTIGRNDLPLVFDAEEDGTAGFDSGVVCTKLHKALSFVEGHTGVQPMVYAPIDVCVNVLNDSFAEYPFWIAHYGDNAKNQPPMVPVTAFARPDWVDMRIMQYSQWGQREGVSADVDLDYFLDPAGIDAFIADRRA